MKLRECLWIWGQDVMSHQKVSANKSWKVPDGNTLDAVAGAEYLDVPNIFRVVMNGKPFPPFDAESEKMKNNPKVIWSALGDASSLRNDDTSDVKEVIRQAEKYPNVVGAVFDDFFRRGTAEDPRWARYSLEEVRKIRSLLHTSLSRKLDLWVVWYKKGLVWPVEEYLKEFDGITYWNMRTAAERSSLREDLDKMLVMTPGKKHTFASIKRQRCQLPLRYHSCSDLCQHSERCIGRYPAQPTLSVRSSEVIKIRACLLPCTFPAAL